MDIIYAELAVCNRRAQSADKSGNRSKQQEEEEEEEEEAEREEEKMPRSNTGSGVVLRPLAKTETEREMPLPTGDGGKVSKEAPKSLCCSLQGFCRVLRVLGLLGLYTAMGVLFFSLPFVVNQTVRLRERFYSPRKLVQENRAGKNFEVEELFPTTFAKLTLHLNVTQPGLKTFASIVAECDRIQDTRRSAIKYLSEVWQSCEYRYFKKKVETMQNRVICLTLNEIMPYYYHRHFQTHHNAVAKPRTGAATAAATES